MTHRKTLPEVRKPRFIYKDELVFAHNYKENLRSYLF